MPWVQLRTLGLRTAPKSVACNIGLRFHALMVSARDEVPAKLRQRFGNQIASRGTFSRKRQRRRGYVECQDKLLDAIVARVRWMTEPLSFHGMRNSLLKLYQAFA